MISKLDESDYESINGTSFHGTIIETTTNKLINALGFEPIRNIDEKTTREWRVETEYGSFCIYDWKYYTEYSDDTKVIWHIGGKSKDKEEMLLDEISKALSMYEDETT